MVSKKGILEKLQEGVVVGDGGMIFALERRGYIDCRYWTPEVTCEHPEAVKQLHKEFIRAGADVIQAFTFQASDHRGPSQKKFTAGEINQAACDIAKDVVQDTDVLVAGAITKTGLYKKETKENIQKIFREQIDVFVREKLDFLICEFFEYIEEVEWAIEVCKETGLFVASTMCIGPNGDLGGVSAGDCGARMAKAGADMLGTNCLFDPFVSLSTLRLMKEAIATKTSANPYLMVQPLGFFTPDAGKGGYTDLPEFPFALEPRHITRWDYHRFTEEAVDMGIRYIGGCCGVEPYHIRAAAQELAEERKKVPEAAEKHEPWAKGLIGHHREWVKQRNNKEYWSSLSPATGRVSSAVFSKPQAR